MRGVFKDLGWKVILLNFLASAFISYIEIGGYISGSKIDFLFSNTFNNLSYGIIVSTIFYIIVILLPKDNKRNHISRFLSNKIGAVYYRLNVLLTHINDSSTSSKKINVNLHEELPSLEVMAKLCKLVDARNIVSPMTKTQSDWLVYLESIAQSTKNDVSDILQFSDLLSSELVGVLSEIDDIASNRLSYEMKIGNTDIEVFAEPILEIVLLSREATKLYQKDYKHYIKSHSKRYRERWRGI